LSVVKKIVIIGPESTGKSELCIYLSQHFKTNYVPEYARQYLEIKSEAYTISDLTQIAKGQILAEDSLIQSANNLLFCDTDAIVIQIWSEVKFNACDKYILDIISNRVYDFYLLMDIDLPWQYDALREAPHLKDRELLLLHYKEILQNYHTPFALISGIHEQRQQNAILAIEKFLKKN
jgi:NadR type nicotinamide-nucleotide adenylyltransferase